MKKVLKYFIKKFVVFYSKRLKNTVENFKLEFQNENLLKKIVSKGSNIKFNGKVIITHPSYVNLGSNIHVGNNAYFHTDGGLTIGDNTHISRNLVLYTSNHNYKGKLLPYDERRIYKSVFIGKNVWIGMNVCITPGVKIGDGAIIGMGAVVSKDVPKGAIVGSPPQRILKYRDKEHYNELELNNRFSGVNGEEYIQRDYKMKTAFELGSNLFFIVGTGRSGSNSIANILSQHPDVECRHEAKPELISLSTQYEHGEISKKEVKDKLKDIYSVHNISTEYYGESDQKLSNLIPILHELFPLAKFIWLIRDPKNVVISTFKRNWFDDREFDLRIRHELAVENYTYRKIYSENRLNGLKINVFSQNEWNSMSPFERNCWYWYFLNFKIQEEFFKLSNQNIFLKLKLEELHKDFDKVTDFLNLTEFPFQDIKTNKANYSLEFNWTERNKKIFNKYCKGNFGYE